MNLNFLAYLPNASCIVLRCYIVSLKNNFSWDLFTASYPNVHVCNVSR